MKTVAKKHTTVGNVKIIKDFSMPQLKTKRRIWIYLPPDYETSSKRYPVLYMHDGQNVFDDFTACAGAWDVDKTMERLFKSRKTPGAIIVGIDNAGKNRMREYNPWAEIGGKGDKYSDFIVDTLKPYIDKNFRTKKSRENTGIMGSSMGAYISLYIALKHPQIFSRVGLLSPAFWLYHDNLKEMLEGVTVIEPVKFYFSVGTEEGDEERTKQYIDWTKFTYEVLSKKMTNKKRIKLNIIKGGIHSETVWAKVFSPAFLWLFK